MPNWLDDALALAQQGEPAVLVTVAATSGSAPRDPGAHLLVSARGIAGSIGGGHLEYQAIAQARQTLESLAQGGAPAPRLQRFALGASLGQCCGGAVQLVFEPIGPHTRDWLAQAASWQRSGMRWCRMVHGGEPPLPVQVLALDDETAHRQLPDAVRQALPRLLAPSGAPSQAQALLLGPRSGTGWTLLDRATAPALPVVLFGAGHVGRALARMLADLPVRVTWVDSRAEELPPDAAPNIQLRCTDVPETEVDAAPAGAAFLVLTHDHALDFELTRRILRRGDFGFFGLIGSQTKRLRFTQRLRARGFDDAQIARMTCPVGMAGIAGKEPEVIALAIAAQLMQWRPPVR